MDIYFYGSYEGSASGFILLRYDGSGLVPVREEANSVLFREIKDFFAYDVFRILWKDGKGERHSRMSLTSAGTLLGVRGLQGQLEGREAAVNIAFTAANEELPVVWEILQNFLWDFEEYTNALFASMTLRKEGGCQVKREEFEKWKNRKCRYSELLLQKIQKAFFIPEFSKYMLSQNRWIPTERELIRFAVCVSDWKDARQYLKPTGLWRVQPVGVLSSKQFERSFLTLR